MEETKQEVGERIRVLASFAPHKILIHFFNWRNRNYRVDTANLFHIEKSNNRSFYHFAVSAAGNDYQIVFNPTTLEWYLRDIVNR
ncbi:hypothetical protein A3A71_02310 [Candidatus Berkelbacteria bacterium RIFCSPLOWO2_01_FULL_50_28]|uniref:Uncharacterized protein n=1 Tax=Candidatus Berkelbacteria bacterium RIFCSPLOWO2_01_FULL_50_28 TaxID=1797471 RepID=A0A1F5EBR7_9BACT|nr:MAG: hypothetical protein A2807_00705 [Candidatus Berkelbacteria bacterium RIFCSPHIGHO2_01_FULL_50_36]OGD62215.1 MAG: hypothetical protein A3F39_00725 [Candidatus Berkelbacteria bacterium RIFCSPHIGHO2_12_FULL_50_11]OGD64857.1 MAG: hypothetical protein A3A71_02310 [Candidatus Berkelbacteria bacterium RIFCSPLOWO2_01_FULL_50_28]